MGTSVYTARSMTNVTPLEPGFYGLGIAPKLLEVLWKLKFKTPTPIQFKSIPIAIEGQDLIGVAQTGTGKTLAFGIPLIQRLAQTKGRGLVILPTRELALQADEVFRAVGKTIGLRTAVLIGGASMHLQHEMLKKKPHVIIATPGRLLDHMEQRTVNLGDIRVLVLDEADRMLDMGFAPQIKKILQALPRDRQTMLFSATMPPDIVRLASSYMKLPVQIEIARSGTMPEKMTQELFVVNKEDKARLLDRIWTNTAGLCWFLRAPSTAPKKWPRWCATWAILRPKSIPTVRWPSGAKHWTVLRAANTGYWWPLTLRPGVWTSKTSNW